MVLYSREDAPSRLQRNLGGGPYFPCSDREKCSQCPFPLLPPDTREPGHQHRSLERHPLASQMSAARLGRRVDPAWGLVPQHPGRALHRPDWCSPGFAQPIHLTRPHFQPAGIPAGPEIWQKGKQ